MPSTFFLGDGRFKIGAEPLNDNLHLFAFYFTFIYFCVCVLKQGLTLETRLVSPVLVGKDNRTSPGFM